jgi:enoyl-CoA hydratase
MTITSTSADGVVEIVLDKPPVNAFTVADWYAIADAITAAGRAPETVAVVLRAEGRAFCAGVDIKEIQAKGDQALLGANRGCFAAFNAVYDCQVPVIAAVQGYCLGGGIGLVGNADIVIAADDAVFGLPEVDRGALGAATHLSRLVPQQVMRYMVYSCRNLTAGEMARYGAILDVVPRADLRARAMTVAADIAGKSPFVIRRAKESLNGIDPVDVHRSYRFEQGFTYEIHVAGVADEHRAAFVERRAVQHEASPTAGATS